MGRTSDRVQQFYTNTQKQVLDVHEEARRLAASLVRLVIDLN